MPKNAIASRFGDVNSSHRRRGARSSRSAGSSLRSVGARAFPMLAPIASSTIGTTNIANGRRGVTGFGRACSTAPSLSWVERVDAVVVGGGVMGSASAWALARRGRDVVVLEQFGPGHTRGSSHGASRIFRLAYPDPFWVRLARHAEGEWRRLGADAGVTLLTRTGSLDHGEAAGVDAIAGALTAVGAPVERLDPAAARERWPGLRFDGAVVHQPDGGRIESARAWAALVGQVRQSGGGGGG